MYEELPYFCNTLTSVLQIPEKKRVVLFLNCPVLSVFCAHMHCIVLLQRPQTWFGAPSFVWSFALLYSGCFLPSLRPMVSFPPNTLHSFRLSCIPSHGRVGFVFSICSHIYVPCSYSSFKYTYGKSIMLYSGAYSVVSRSFSCAEGD